MSDFLLHLVSRSVLMVFASFLLFVPSLMTQVYCTFSAVAAHCTQWDVCFSHNSIQNVQYARLRRRGKLWMVTLLRIAIRSHWMANYPTPITQMTVNLANSNVLNNATMILEICVVIHIYMLRDQCSLPRCSNWINKVFQNHLFLAIFIIHNIRVLFFLEFAYDPTSSGPKETTSATAIGERDSVCQIQLLLAATVC